MRCYAPYLLLPRMAYTPKQGPPATGPAINSSRHFVSTTRYSSSPHPPPTRKDNKKTDMLQYPPTQRALTLLRVTTIRQFFLCADTENDTFLGTRYRAGREGPRSTRKGRGDVWNTHLKEKRVRPPRNENTSGGGGVENVKSGRDTTSFTYRSPVPPSVNTILHR